MDKSLRFMIKKEHEVAQIEKACRIVAETLELVGKHIKPGVETIELDKIAEDYIRSKNAKPAFKGFRDGRKVFPYTLCISIDDVVVHGMPGKRKLEEGEIISVDCGAQLDGYFGDAALSFPVGAISEEKQKLLEITKESLYCGIAQAIEGKKIYDISKAIQDKVESVGYSLTRELVGHGIGKNLHEEPPVPNFLPPLLQRKKFPNVKLAENMTICIEPMVHAGAKEVYTDVDGWTVRTRDKSPAAHFEHTVVIGKNSARILTLI